MFTRNSLQPHIKRKVSIDDLLLYIAKGCDIHPLLYDYLLDELEQMSIKGKMSLVPISVLQLYHRRLKRRQTG